VILVTIIQCAEYSGKENHGKNQFTKNYKMLNEVLLKRYMLWSGVTPWVSKI